MTRDIAPATINATAETMVAGTQPSGEIRRLHRAAVNAAVDCSDDGRDETSDAFSYRSSTKYTYLTAAVYGVIRLTRHKHNILFFIWLESVTK